MDIKGKTAAVRRQHILEAAVAVFAECGFRGASMRDIAKAAGVAEGTIYNSFASKFDLLIAILDPLSDRLSTARVPKGLRDALEGRLSAFDESALAMMRTLLSEALVDPEVRQLFVERVIGATLDPRGRGAQAGRLYAANALCLGMVMLRLLDTDNSKLEGAAIELVSNALASK